MDGIQSLSDNVTTDTNETIFDHVGVLLKPLILFITYAMGPTCIVLICVTRQRCTHKLHIILVLLSGILFRIFNIIMTSKVVKTIESENFSSIRCVDFNPPVVFLTGTTGLIILFGVIEKSCENRLYKIYQYIFLLYVCSSCTCIAYLYIRSGIELLQFPIFATEEDDYYLSICLFNPLENPLPMIMEYGVLIIPLTIIFMIYFYHIYNGKHLEIRFDHEHLLSAFYFD